ncbi:TlpA family protein disulfide reductase [Advenella kashmirensis]
MNDAIRDYNTPNPVSWSRAWQNDPLGGDLSEEWSKLIECFRARAPLGSVAPECKGKLLDGLSFDLADYRVKKSVLIVFGSYACPPCVTNINRTTPNLNELYKKYKNSVQFIYVYTREAHPGALIKPHESIEDKLTNAARLKSEENVTFPILIDNLDGEIQKSYADPQFNNPVFLVNQAGRIAYKSAWLDSSELPQVLEDQVLWDQRSATDLTIKKTFSERIRILREPFDPVCNQRIKKLMEEIGLAQKDMGPIPGIETDKAGK